MLVYILSQCFTVKLLSPPYVSACNAGIGGVVLISH